MDNDTDEDAQTRTNKPTLVLRTASARSTSDDGSYCLTAKAADLNAAALDGHAGIRQMTS